MLHKIWSNHWMRLFLVLSLADLLTTTWLLTNRTAIYESNPAARWMLDQFGWTGLASFKISAVLVALFTLGTLLHHRPEVGRRVLLFGCMTVGMVVLYSAMLATVVEDCSPPHPPTVETHPDHSLPTPTAEAVPV